MATASSASRLNPTAPPFKPTTLARPKFGAPIQTVLVPADLLAPQCLYPPPPPPPACLWPAVARVGCCWCVSGRLPSNGCACARLFMAGAPVFPPPAAACVQVQTPPPPRQVMMVCYYPAPPPKPATRCRIVEIGEDGSEEATKDEPSPRSVLPICNSRKLPATAPGRRRAALPSPPAQPRLSLQGKASRRRFPRLAFDPNTDYTSLMIRNIPNKFMKKRFMAILDQHCAEENAKLNDGGDGDSDGNVMKSEYDFLYVPVDFWTKYNKGYAFVNMTTPAAARRLHAHLHGHGWGAVSSRKVCDVVHARVQGLDALVAHFAGSLFPCEDEELLPARFEPPRDGVRATAEHVVGRLLAARTG